MMVVLWSPTRATVKLALFQDNDLNSIPPGPVLSRFDRFRRAPRQRGPRATRNQRKLTLSIEAA